MKTFRWYWMVAVAVFVSMAAAFAADGEVPPVPAPTPEGAVNWFNLIITGLTPIVILGLKKIVPQIPGWLLPIAAPVVGLGLGWALQKAGAPTDGGLPAIVWGGLGVWLRELQDQLRKAGGAVVAPVALFLAGTMLLTSCTTLQFNTGTKIVARRATVEVLKRTSTHPEYKAAIAASVTAIDQLLLQPNLDRARIAATLQGLKIRELKGSDGALLLADLLDLIDNAIADKPLIGDGLPRLQSFLRSVADGMSEAVAMFP